MADSKQVTLNDVAQASGVSYQTVSRVINGHPYVADGTRERVQRAISSLGYQPNLAARSLVTGKSKTVGLIGLGSTFYGPVQTAVHIEKVLKQKGFALLIANIDKPDLSEMCAAVKALKRQLVDGIIMIMPLLSSELSEVRKACAQTPFVVIDAKPDEQIPAVAIDQYAGARLATEHLLELGHTTFCTITGPLRWYDALYRYKGYKDTLTEADVEPGMQLEGDWSARSGFEMTGQLLKKASGFSALVVGNDQMALGALHALHQKNIRVPEDVAVIGFDDIPEAAFLTPSLSTVRQDFSALGLQSAEYLTELIDNPEALLSRRLLQPQLKVRHSTLGLD